MSRKPFDADLHNKCDKKGRDFVRKHFPPGYEIVDNDLKTGVDLLVFKDGVHICNIEPEIKRVWKGEFSYDTVHLPIRKSKYCYLEKPTLFVIFRADGKEFFCVWDKYVLQSEIKEVHNKFVKSGELFFNIPVSTAKRSFETALRQRWQKKED